MKKVSLLLPLGLLAAFLCAFQNGNNFPIAQAKAPNLVAQLDVTGQVANLGSQTLYTVPATGQGTYRLECNIIVTTAAQTSSTLPACQPGWVDRDNAQTQAIFTTTLPTGNSLTTMGLAQNTSLMSVAASSVITFQTASYASVGSPAMAYAVHVRLFYEGP